MAPSQVTEIDTLRDVLDNHRRNGQTIGFTPTMGFLHPGHGSLMAAARAETNVVVTSIFVNPLQFAAGEDLSTYPSDLANDEALAAQHSVDYLFIPSVAEMYPNGSEAGNGVLTSVEVSDLSARWDGESRPTHFSGMATVVAKLFNIVGPCRAYFGEKDFQQLAIIRTMVSDLSIPVEIVGCPIVRESDGLAMSSRNSYLLTNERAAATVVRRALDAGQAAIAHGVTSPSEVVDAIARVVEAEPLAKLDYAAVVDNKTLATPAEVGPTSHLLIAVYLGKTRLIDNCSAHI